MVPDKLQYFQKKNKKDMIKNSHTAPYIQCEK